MKQLFIFSITFLISNLSFSSQVETKAVNLFMTTITLAQRAQITSTPSYAILARCSSLPLITEETQHALAPHSHQIPNSLIPVESRLPSVWSRFSQQEEK
ncbi:MAG: hypothetical protein UR26_C0002G0003 [candidate division TM6 bacterium GW2011_GWF2_32_72]|nr:MAG: hypothetical protein UR26_C0002G0003 [candidate division TM6 bacterium GW2011_GWF2_32_72]